MKITINNLLKLIVLSGMSISLVSCVVIDNPFKKKNVTSETSCDTDLSLPVEIERAQFTPPDIWSRLKPCKSIRISRNTNTDEWGISAALYYTYSDILVYDFGMGFGVIGELNLIGSTPNSLAGWRRREDNKWLRRMKNRGEADTRAVTYESRNGLDCWRTETIAYDKGTQSAQAIEYNCWEPGKTHYPPLSIIGSIRYWEGKPVYDLDIDKDLIDPVFATLKVKDIKPEVYAERMAAYKEREKRQCKGRIKYVRKNPNKGYTVSDIDLLEDCGYDTSKLKRKEE